MFIRKFLAAMLVLSFCLSVPASASAQDNTGCLRVSTYDVGFMDDGGYSHGFINIVTQQGELLASERLSDLVEIILICDIEISQTILLIYPSNVWIRSCNYQIYRQNYFIRLATIFCYGPYGGF